jgi:hypothetical protein
MGWIYVPVDEVLRGLYVRIKVCFSQVDLMSGSFPGRAVVELSLLVENWGNPSGVVWCAQACLMGDAEIHPFDLKFLYRGRRLLQCGGQLRCCEPLVRGIYFCGREGGGLCCAMFVLHQMASCMRKNKENRPRYLLLRQPPSYEKQ